MSSAPARAGAAVAIALACVVAGLASAPPADAASASVKALRYLKKAQNRDGGFGAARGQSSSQLFSGWAALGVASARRNPRDVRRRGGRAITTYLRRRGGSLRDIGEVERTILVLKAAGLSPRSFAGRDLVAEVHARRRGDGSFSSFVSYTAFGLLALKAAGEALPASSVSWLERSQNDDGGFGVARSSSSDADMTGAALQALVAAGRGGTGVTRRAVAYLRGLQGASGGMGMTEGQTANVQSTSYAIQGLVAAGADGEVVDRAIAYIKRLQRRNGSIRYSRSSSQTPVWVTAQALTALRRKPFPLATAPRRKRRKRARRSTASPAAETGSEKTSTEGGAAPTAREPASSLRSSEKATSRLAPRPTGATARTATSKDGDGPSTGLIVIASLTAVLLAAAARLGLRRWRRA